MSIQPKFGYAELANHKFAFENLYIEFIINKRAVKMRKDLAEIRKHLESFDKKYEKDRTLSEKLEQYRRK